jgi:hypothetical protein
MIETWESQWPHGNIGIVTGSSSGLLVVDVDGEDGQKRVVLPLMLPRPTQARNSGRAKHCS